VYFFGTQCIAFKSSLMLSVRYFGYQSRLLFPFILKYSSTLVLLLFWHALLGVRSAIRRHQPPPRTVLSQIDCIVQCKVVSSQITLDGVQPRDTGTPWWSLPVLWWGAVRIILASASSSIRAMCPNKERHRNWIIAVSLRCLVILLTSSLRTNWCHLIPSSVPRHHRSRASLLCASTVRSAVRSV